MTHLVVYGDLSHYDSRDGGKPEPRDVQVIVQSHKDIGWHTQSGYDYYVWQEAQDRFVGVDLFGLFDWLLERGDVLFGRTTTQDDFDRAMRVALKLRSVEQEKTGWLSGERRADG